MILTFFQYTMLIYSAVMPGNVVLSSVQGVRESWKGVEGWKKERLMKAAVEEVEIRESSGDEALLLSESSKRPCLRLI